MRIWISRRQQGNATSCEAAHYPRMDGNLKRAALPSPCSVSQMLGHQMCSAFIQADFSWQLKELMSAKSLDACGKWLLPLLIPPDCSHSCQQDQDAHNVLASYKVFFVCLFVWG